MNVYGEILCGQTYQTLETHLKYSRNYLVCNNILMFEHQSIFIYLLQRNFVLKTVRKLLQIRLKNYLHINLITAHFH